jgi:putative CocE/NonD family hydrolase
MVTMRDGIRLATDVYLPTEKDGKVLAGRLPTIMTREPRNKDDWAAGRYWASHGYAAVVQDTRGRFKSEGKWFRWVDDFNDSYDTGEWLAKQPWSDGRFGVNGCSYTGGTTLVTAMTQPSIPGLVTVVAEDATSDEAIQNRRNFGAYEGRSVKWEDLEGADPALIPVDEEMSKYRMEYMKHLPFRYGTTPLKHAPDYERWVIEAMKAGRANDPFWAHLRIRKEYGPYQEAHHFKKMPAYHVGGWYDSKPGNTTGNFTAIEAAGKGPGYLIMGPWIHCQHNAYRHGQVTFGRDAAINQREVTRTWFDHWLKGKDNEVSKKEGVFGGRVRLFVMGTGDGTKDKEGFLNHGGYWRNENEWPLARTQNTPYYFHGDGTLSPVKPEAASSSTTYDYDPRDPVPTIGGNISSQGAARGSPNYTEMPVPRPVPVTDAIMLQGAYDQKGGPHVWNWQAPIPLAMRTDVVVFQTAPLEQDLEVTGELQVKLWVSSSAKDTDFTAKIVDVYPASKDYPAGFDLNITDGIMRARFRESLFEEKFMVPDSVYELTITLYPTSNVFKKGHRLRVDISSSNFPRFIPNTNSGEPLGTERRKVIATNTIYHDRSRPSHFIVPVIPTTGGPNR